MATNHYPKKNSQILTRHNPSHSQTKNQKSLTIVLGLTTTFFLVELFGAFWTHSLALLSDAIHMLSDIGALGLALFAAWAASKPARANKTFGYYRAEVLAAFFNSALLLIIAITIFREAYTRIHSPIVIKTIPMLIIATIGLAINLVGAFILSQHQNENINIRGALIHVLGDTLGSLGAITAGLVIWIKGWLWFDPLISFLIGAIIIFNALRILWDTVNILMQGAPRHINLEQIRRSMLQVEGVKEICDLHIWTLTSHLDMLSAHVIVNNIHQSMEVLKDLQKLLQENYGLEHVTIQIEDGSTEICKTFV